MANSIDKIILRKQLQDQRKALSQIDQKIYSEQICQQIVKSAIFQSARNIAFYTPVKGEASPLPLANEPNKTFYLPLLSNQQKHHLFFVSIDEGTQYKNNIYNIPEPIYKNTDILPTTELDLVIMPLVAADKHGSRLGMGGGYYDRSFSFKKDIDVQKPILMGFAYDFQVVDKLSAESWDVPLDYLASNHELIKVRD